MNKEENKLGLLNLLVILLSVYVLVALMVESFTALPPEISRLLNYIDYGICIFFIIEFCIRFYKAENKLRFMRWGWIDLISSIPMIDYLRTGRILRLIRLIRIIRAFRSVKNIVDHVFTNRAKGTLTSVFALTVLLIMSSSIAILLVETDPKSNIKTAEDAIWWCYVTITTVGYGDKFPVTTEGRIIASVLMTAGVGLFGTFTAYIASWFVSSKNSEGQ